MIGIIIFLITLIIYFCTSSGTAGYLNYFVPLSEAFWHGRLFVQNHPSWLSELVLWQGHYFVVYPPMPAILLMPFVAIFGPNFPQPFLSKLLGSINILLCYLVVLKIFRQKKIAVWVSVLYAFGSMQWYHAALGSAWYFAHICALFFLWLLILEVITKKRSLLIGLFIGAAYLSRLPTILSLVFPLFYLREQYFNFETGKLKLNIKEFILLGLGLAPFLIGNAFYNYFRFGVFYDAAYSLLPIFNEPWYKNGLFSLKNIPVHLGEIWLAMPKFQSHPPFVIPNLFVMSLFLVMPALFLAFNANYKSRIGKSALLTALIISLPDLMHGSNGSTQFGYRFALDFMPLLLLLISSTLENGISLTAKLLIILSIVMNLWGIIDLTILNVWTIFA